ncbi:MAG: AMP-binding protein [Bacteroidota bacterium]
MHPDLPISTLNQLLAYRAQSHSDKIVYTYLDQHLQPAKTLTNQELYQESLKLAAALSAKAKPGERALLLFPPGLEYVEAYFGCLAAGIVAVPVYPPMMARQINRLMQIIQDAQPSVFMSTSDVYDQVMAVSPEWGSFFGDKWIKTDQVQNTPLAKAYDAKPDELAFLQYTSGSTGAPKGVMVSHANLIANEKMITEGFEMKEDSVGVNWLPLYHDMGLIGTVIQVLYVGATSYLMSPFTFLSKPKNWLQAISTFKGTHCGGPNFAYELCTRKLSDEEVASLDLSSWKYAFNGAEPILASTLQKFEQKFAPVGFTSDTWLNCYGLAEATLMVSTSKLPHRKTLLEVDGEALKDNLLRLVRPTNPDSRTLVSSGFPSQPQDIRIVHPDTKTLLPSDQIGEIWLQGPHIAQGYWQQEEKNLEMFQAEIEGLEGTYLRTGDLGFMHEGQLYIAGRQKDLIIIRGRNYYPQDIEQTVYEAHAAIQPGGTAAFSIESEEGEQLVIVSELRSDLGERFSHEEVIRQIQQQLGIENDLQAQHITLIPKRKLLKTSSGKVQRSANKKAFLKGKFEALHAYIQPQGEESPQDETALNGPIDLQSWIVNWMAEKLSMRADQIELDDPITAYGVDSLMLAEFETEISEYMGMAWPVRDVLLGEPNIEELAEKGMVFLQENQPV